MNEPSPVGELSLHIALMSLMAVGGGVVLLASRALRRRDGLPGLLMPVALLLLVGGFAADLMALWDAGLRPSVHAHAAASYALLVWQGLHVAVAVIMLAGMINLFGIEPVAALAAEALVR